MIASRISHISASIIPALASSIGVRVYMFVVLDRYAGYRFVVISSVVATMGP